MARAIICMRAKFIWSRFHPLEVRYLLISSIRMVELQRFSQPMMRASCWVNVSSLTASAFLRSSSSRALRSAMRRHGFLVELFVIAHHALSILNHSGEHGCQSVTFILVKAGKFSKAKDTTMLSLAIFVDVRLRETVVIVCDCRTISLIAIFLCLGYIHFGGKGTHNFSTDKTGGCSISGGEHTLQIRIFYTKSARKLAENCQNLGFR